MPHRDLLAIGTSAGGVEALRALAKGFPPDLPAAVLITIHLSSQFRSGLDAILTRSGPLVATFAVDGEPVSSGHIYIAPPARHLLVDGERLSLGLGPRENQSRPAIDPMFRSVACCCGARAIGVVLTGTLGDGASGLCALARCGGTTIVQDPRDAAYSEMPNNALSLAKPDHVVRLADMPALFARLLDQPVEASSPCPDGIRYEVEVARGGSGNMDDMDRIGRRSVLACPDCGGVMWEIDDGALVRFRCHVGHAYTADVMSMALDENLRRALGSALRALDERIALVRKLQKQADERDSPLVAADWAGKAREYEREADVIRHLIRRMDKMAARFQQAAE